MQISGKLSPQQYQALDRLHEGLKHHDQFGAVHDGSGVFICPENTLYELPYSINNIHGHFALGDLRDILSIFFPRN